MWASVTDNSTPLTARGALDLPWIFLFCPEFGVKARFLLVCLRSGVFVGPNLLLLDPLVLFSHLLRHSLQLLLSFLRRDSDLRLCFLKILTSLCLIYEPLSPSFLGGFLLTTHSVDLLPVRRGETERKSAAVENESRNSATATTSKELRVRKGIDAFVVTIVGIIVGVKGAAAWSSGGSWFGTGIVDGSRPLVGKSLMGDINLR